MEKKSNAKISLISAMAIFGTIGIFRKYIPLPSGIVACARGILGVAFLLAFIKVKKIKMDFESISVICSDPDYKDRLFFVATAKQPTLRFKIGRAHV